MSKLMYKPVPMYKSNINDMVEALEKGGPGSGKRGHTTAKIDKQKTQSYIDKFRMKHPDGMHAIDAKEWFEGAGLNPEEVHEAVKRITPKTAIGLRSRVNVGKY